MISTLYLLTFLAFFCWYSSSRQVKSPGSSAILNFIRSNPKYSRLAGMGLMIVVTAVFVYMFGLMSGICAAIVGLMGIGSLVILLFPIIHYLFPIPHFPFPFLLILYVCCLTLEILL